jgi:pSer/pThr/pTyr-binding forkhead associated (FHA) protein
MTIRLAVSLRDVPVRTYALDQQRITLGRAPTCDVVLENLALSRLHAVITRDGDEWVVRDQGSRNGIHVNGQRAPERSLATGDIITIGKFQVAVALEDGPDRVTDGALAALAARACGARIVDATPDWVNPSVAATAHLVVKRGQPVGVFGLERDVFHIGGHKSCELRLTSAFAPRRLAMIVRGLAGYGLVNLTANAEGVWKNGKPVVDRCWLDDGDKIELQDVLARFALGPATPASAERD